MNKAFTLLELMIVLVIVGVLSTLGVMQYQSAIERSRDAEAKQILGQLRSKCGAIYMTNNATDECSHGNLGIGTSFGQAPEVGSCAETHYFGYVVLDQSGATITLVAERCDASGKGNGPVDPNDVGRIILLDIDYLSGDDAWITMDAMPTF